MYSVNQSSTPLVSVLMTAYNREGFIAEAIESVLASSYRNLELIIVDDCSSDRTVSVAKSYQAGDQRIKLFVNEKNIGDYPNRNKAAGLANGKYIVFTDSDDWMYPDTLFQWVQLMELNAAHFGIYISGVFQEPAILSPESAIRHHFFKQSILMYGPCATIVTKEYFKAIGGFPEKYGPASDMYYNLKAASQTNTIFIPFPLGGYRLHEGQEINNQVGYLNNGFCYLRDALNDLNLPLTPAEKKFLCQTNKRRFVFNCFYFLIQTKALGRTMAIIRRTGFTWKDLFQAVYIRKMSTSKV